MTALELPLIEERHTRAEWRRILDDPTDRDAYQRTRLGVVAAQYLAWKTPGASARTLVIYEGYLARLCVHFVDQGIDPAPGDVTSQMLVEALTTLYRRGSFRIVRTVYNDFFGWCEEEGLVARSPARRMPRIKEPAMRVYDVFTPAEQAMLLKAADQLHIPWLQRLRVLCFLDLGIRKAEARGLTVAAFDAASRTVVVKGKGEKERVVPLSEEIWRAFVGYRNRPLPKVRMRDNRGVYHASRPPLDSDYLFFPYGVSTSRLVTWTDPAKPLAERPLHAWWENLCGLAGVRYRSLHMCRHTAATELATAEIDVLAIGEWLGHASPETTKVYVHNSRSRLQQAAARRDAYRKALGG